MADQHSGRDAACDGCDLGRRAFLRDAAVVTAAFAALGTKLGAMPVRSIAAIGGGNGTVSYPIPAGDGVNIDKKNDVIVARHGEKIFAFARTCPHQNTALAWQGGAKEFQCPKHHSRYTPEGVFIDGRATRSMDRFAVKKDGGNLVVDLDKLFQQDTDAAQWTAAFVTA